MEDVKSQEKQASGTAMATTFMRAMAATDPKIDIGGADYLAEIFLAEDQKLLLKNPASRTWVMKNKVTPGAFEFMIARTAFFDRIVEQALITKTRQIVFIGAGYDSRPYRFEKSILDTSIYELDTNPTLQRKQLCLQQANIPQSKQISYVPVDFDSDNLSTKLQEAGFSRDKRTLFVWEGVTYYLSAEVVDNMLLVLKHNSLPGSSLCFDYAALSRKALEERNAKQLREHLSSQHPDEPTKFGIAAGEIEPFLARHGFEVIEHLSADDMNKAYLNFDDQAEIGKVPPLFCLVHAKIK